MSEWTDVTIGDLGELFDGPHATPTRTDSGPYFLNIASLKNGRLDLSKSDHVSASDYIKWTRRVTPRDGDLLFSYETRLGEAALMPAGVEACLGRRMALLRPNESVVYPRFLLYLFLSDAFQRTIAKNTIHGATVPRIGLKSMPTWTVPVPSLAEQSAIADVLGSLDDKITANARLSEAVDDLASATFARFSSDRTDTLDSIATVNSLTVKPAGNGQLRYVDIASVGVGAINWPPLIEWASAPSRARRGLKFGDTVWSTVRPNRRSHALWLDDGPSAVASTGLAVLTPHPRRAAGLYEATRLPQFEAYLMSVAQGSAYPAVNASHFANAPIPRLDESTWDAFEQEVFPLRQRAHAGIVENRHLTTTRDALLPLLMSGKLRVKDAEKVVSDAV